MLAKSKKHNCKYGNLHDERRAIQHFHYETIGSHFYRTFGYSDFFRTFATQKERLIANL